MYCNQIGGALLQNKTEFNDIIGSVYGYNAYNNTQISYFWSVGYQRYYIEEGYQLFVALLW